MTVLKRIANRLGLPFGEPKITYNSRLAQEVGKLHGAVGIHLRDGSDGQRQRQQRHSRRGQVRPEQHREVDVGARRRVPGAAG